MTQRPDRTLQDSFELHDHPVIFRFLDSTHVHITIPANSKWWFPIHWHTQNPASCDRVTSLNSQIRIYAGTPSLASDGGYSLSPGSPFKFRPGDHHAFGPDREDEELVALLEVEPSQTILLRNSCSATLDAQLYPSLASTRYWIRLIYGMLSFSPRAQQSLTEKLLWVQIQMMRSMYDFNVRHGKINAPYLWWLAHPWHWDREPQWTHDLMWRSYTPISKAVQGTCYWVGRLLLGMKAEYAKYMPAAGSERESVDLIEKLE